MSALYLTHHGPWPVTSGGRLRDAALVPHLARRTDLQLWAVSRTVDLDRRAAGERNPDFPVRIFPDEAQRRVFPTRDSAAARRELRACADAGPSFDVVHVEGHYLFHLLPPRLAERSVLVEHNVESHLLRQRAAHSTDPDGLLAEIRAVEAAEEAAWNRAGLVLTLSEEDRRRIRGRAPSARVAVCPNGADHVPLGGQAADPDPTQIGLAPRIGFLANYGYPPNQDAVRWLLDAIFPRIQRAMPGAELLLAGFRLSDAVEVDDLPPGVVPLGWVDDVHDVWSKVDVAICPLRIGGGVKVKMIDAVRCGCLIVSTGVGLEGMPQAVTDAVIRADDAEDFAAAVIRACSDRDLRAELRSRMNRARRTLPAWSSVAAATHRHWTQVAQNTMRSSVGK